MGSLQAPQNINLILTELQKQQVPKILAVLVRLFGAHNFSMAEDVLQDAMYKALICWQTQGIPDNPSAWLITAAKHQALDKIRQTRTHTRYANDLSHFLQSEWTLDSTLDSAFSEEKIKDDQLRMVFMCCHCSVSPENRIPFILKNLCGLSIEAISKALFIKPATIKKRLLRTKVQLQHYQFILPEDDQLAQAMDTVHTALYLLFNEGFHCSNGIERINLMFCKEAIALVQLLLDEQNIANQDTFGLLAMMHFHMARIPARIDQNGCNIPIDLQDRTLWQPNLIRLGNELLHVATRLARPGVGRFYIESKIAQWHVKAFSFEQTNWPEIVELYNALFDLTGSPIVALNRAVALAYSGKIHEAIEQVEVASMASQLTNSYLPLATLAHLHGMAGQKDEAVKYLDSVKQSDASTVEVTIIEKQVLRALGQH